MLPLPRFEKAPAFDWSSAVKQADGSYVDKNDHAYVSEAVYAEWTRRRDADAKR